MKTFCIIIRLDKYKAKEVEIIKDSKENLIRLIEQYQNLVFSICLKMTGDYFTAEDITQDTFIAALNSWSRFDGVNEKAWICRIATNKCIDYIRTSKNNIVPIDDEMTSTLSDAKETLQEIINRDVMEEFENAVNSLDEPYKSVAKSYFIDGKTAKEISYEKDVGLKTIQTQIYRARSMLKKCIRKEDLMT